VDFADGRRITLNSSPEPVQGRGGAGAGAGRGPGGPPEQ
jgi:hypothetical protein